jgi:hypothetical protein
VDNLSELDDSMNPFPELDSSIDLLPKFDNLENPLLYPDGEI